MGDFHCPLDCPNRKTKQMGKGYSFLFSLAITGLLAWQSIDVKYSRDGGWELASKEVPIALLIPCSLLIAGALGLDTDSMAQKVGAILSNDK